MDYRTRNQIRKITRKVLGHDRRALARMNPEDRALLERIRAARLTYLSNSKLEALINTVRGITAGEVQGVFLEAGCALGGSTILLAKLKEVERLLVVYDVFGTIPAPTDQDHSDAHQRFDDIRQWKSKGIGGDRYYGYEDDLYEMVKANLSAFGFDLRNHHIELKKGLLQETMAINGPIAFAHIDVDWYEPVKVSLERIVPHLSVGGAIIVDDYFDWAGCKKATDEYFADRAEHFHMDNSAGSMKFTRLR